MKRTVIVPQTVGAGISLDLCKRNKWHEVAQSECLISEEQGSRVSEIFCYECNQISEKRLFRSWLGVPLWSFEWAYMLIKWCSEFSVLWCTKPSWREMKWGILTAKPERTFLIRSAVTQWLKSPLKINGRWFWRHEQHSEKMWWEGLCLRASTCSPSPS